MNQKAIDALMATKAKFGGDTSIALGPVGAGSRTSIKSKKRKPRLNSLGFL